MKAIHLQLFWFERHQTLLDFDELPELTPAQVDLLKAWAKNKRKILKFEVHQQPWIKIGYDGNATQIICKPTGEVFEENLFGQQVNQGAWKVENGLLIITIQDGEYRMDYRIVGSKDNSVHVGSEYLNNRPSGYVKFVQTKPI